MSNQRKEGSAWALLPLGVFLVLFIGSGIISGDFYKMPTLVAFIISTAVAFLFNRKVEGKIMVVRRAEIKDIEKINELLLQVAMVHHYGRPDLFKANCRKYKNDELVEIIKDDNRPIFVAEDDGVVMGYAFCVITDRKDDNVLTDMKNLYIDDLCVDENMRDKHVGTVIYDYVKKYAKEIGCYNLTLNVWSCNESAQKFYERQGLKPQKTTMETIL